MLNKGNFAQIAKDFGGKNASVKDYGRGPGIRGRADFNGPLDAQAFVELCKESGYVRDAKPEGGRTLVSFWR